MNEIADTKKSSANGIRRTGRCDKSISLTEATQRYLKNGIKVAIGGFINTRAPVASIHEIIRQGVQDLTIVIQSDSICCELLAGAMILKPNHLSLRRVELGNNCSKIIGHAPLLRYLKKTGTIQLVDRGSHPIESKFKNESVDRLSLPPRQTGGQEVASDTRPDLALIHVQFSDRYGNSQIFGEQCACYDIARSSLHTMVTAEQLVESRVPQRPRNATEIPGHLVSAVVDQPFGATPGACDGNYWFDIPEIQEFTNICREFCKTGKSEKLEAYYNKHIFDVKNFDEFLDQKPYPVLQQICLQDDGQQIIAG